MMTSGPQSLRVQTIYRDHIIDFLIKFSKSERAERVGSAEGANSVGKSVSEL